MVDLPSRVNMQELTTRAQLARESGLDSRDQILDSLEPAAQVKLRGVKPVKLYSREEAIKVISAALLEGSKRNS